MKRSVLLLAAIIGTALPSMAQKNGVFPGDEVICKKCRNTVVKNEKGIFMNVYDKGEKAHLTWYLGQDEAQAAASVKEIQQWYGDSGLREYRQNHGCDHEGCGVTLYHGSRHCYMSYGNGEYCRRYSSRKQAGKEFMVAPVPEKFLKKAYEALQD